MFYNKIIQSINLGMNFIVKHQIYKKYVLLLSVDLVSPCRTHQPQSLQWSFNNWVNLETKKLTDIL